MKLRDRALVGILSVALVVLSVAALAPSLQTAEVSGTLPRVSLEQAVAALERDLIQDALKSARGGIARAARLLDSTERVVAYKIRQLGLDPARFRGATKPHMIVEGD